MSIAIPCPRVDYETNDDGIPINACTGIIWRPDANGDPEPTPDTGGEFTFSITEDSEGDFSEPGGRLVHHFTSVECAGQTCVCDLTDKEYEGMLDKAIEQAKDRDYD